MKIRTVCGDIEPDQLGVTLPHEHLLIDVSCRHAETSDPYLRSIADRPMEYGILADAYRHQSIFSDNLRLTDENTAIEELLYFKAQGGQSLVDMTSKWIGGDPVALRRIAEATGINIIAGSAYYSPVLPDDIADASIDELADRLVTEVTDGFAGTDIRAGVIGEIGTSWPLTEYEEKTLRAAARAQLRTGAALAVHTWPWEDCALPLLDIVESEGVDLGRVAILHLDHLFHVEYQKRVAARGAYVTYDRFGVERYRDLHDSLQTLPHDTDRVAGLAELIRCGYGEQTLISHDVCMKIDLRKYGGAGYGHILRYIVPMMRRMGIGEKDIQTILVSNPARLLAF